MENQGSVLQKIEEKVGMTTESGLERELKETGQALSRIKEERQSVMYRIRKRLLSDEDEDR